MSKEVVPAGLGTRLFPFDVPRKLTSQGHQFDDNHRHPAEAIGRNDDCESVMGERTSGKLVSVGKMLRIFRIVKIAFV